VSVQEPVLSGWPTNTQEVPASKRPLMNTVATLFKPLLSVSPIEYMAANGVAAAGLGSVSEPPAGIPFSVVCLSPVGPATHETR
jgi:hypothetical protein